MTELAVVVADLDRIHPDEIPAGVRHHAGIEPDDPLNEAYVVSHPDGGAETYVMQSARYPTRPSPGNGHRAFSETSLVDVLQDGGPAGVITGEGAIRFTAVPGDERDVEEDDGKAIVSWNETEEGYFGRGFGRRRLLVMNAASMMLYDSVLHSGTTLAPEARRLWEKFAEEGIAKPYTRKNGRFRVYRFLA
jgi:hypothetical protein